MSLPRKVQGLHAPLTAFGPEVLPSPPQTGIRPLLTLQGGGLGGAPEEEPGGDMFDYLRIMLNGWLATRDERGASAVEYGLLVAGIAALILAVVFAFGG